MRKHGESRYDPAESELSGTLLNMEKSTPGKAVSLQASLQSDVQVDSNSGATMKQAASPQHTMNTGVQNLPGEGMAISEKVLDRFQNMTMHEFGLVSRDALLPVDQKAYDQELARRSNTQIKNPEVAKEAISCAPPQKSTMKVRLVVIGILNVIFSLVFFLVVAAQMTAYAETDWSQYVTEAHDYIMADFIATIFAHGATGACLFISGIVLLARRKWGRSLTGFAIFLILLYTAFEAFVAVILIPGAFPTSPSYSNRGYYVYEIDYFPIYRALALSIYPIIGYLVLPKKRIPGSTLEAQTNSSHSFFSDEDHAAAQNLAIHDESFIKFYRQSNLRLPEAYYMYTGAQSDYAKSPDRQSQGINGRVLLFAFILIAPLILILSVLLEMSRVS